MTSAQKVAKYFAIGLAAFLIFSICSGAVFGGLGLLTAGKYIKNNSRVEAACTSSETACLQINLSISKLNIKTGDRLSVDTKNDKVEITEDGQTLTVIEKGHNYLNGWGDRDITIYIPADTKFETVAISGGVGSINIESLRAKNLEMALGIGETKINDLSIDHAKISTGIGALSVGLTSSDYEITVEKGVGEVKLNDTKIPNNTTIGSGENKLTISAGIGSVKITAPDSSL